MSTIQDLINALDSQNENDSFKLGYLKGFVEMNILPLLNKKQLARVQNDLNNHIKRT